MSEAQTGIVRKVFANDGAKGGCSVYLEGVDGPLYCNKPYKASDFVEGGHIKYVVKKTAGKGYVVEKARMLEADELPAQPAQPTHTAPPHGAATNAAKTAPKVSAP